MIKNFFCLLCSLTISFWGLAQSKDSVSIKKYNQKIKPPALRTQLANFKDSVCLPIVLVKSVLDSALTVYDSKGNKLTVTYYRFLYRKRAVTEDEKTGKFTPTVSLSSDYFTETPIPKKWTKIIKSDLSDREELYFFDVVAQDKDGRPFYAPPLKIITK